MPPPLSRSFKRKRGSSLSLPISPPPFSPPPTGIVQADVTEMCKAYDKTETAAVIATVGELGMDKLLLSEEEATSLLADGEALLQKVGQISHFLIFLGESGSCGVAALCKRPFALCAYRTVPYVGRDTILLFLREPKSLETRIDLVKRLVTLARSQSQIS